MAVQTLSNVAVERGNVSYINGGKFGGAYDFDGVTGFLVLQDISNTAAAVYSNSAFTVCIWFRADLMQDATLFALNAGDNSFPEYYAVKVAQGFPRNKLRLEIFELASGISTEILAVDSALEVAPNVWGHVAIVDDNGAVTVYVDGVADSVDFDYTRPTLALLDRIFTGANFDPGIMAGHFDGIIDDVRIYDKALSAAEVLDVIGDAAIIELPSTVVGGGGIVTAASSATLELIGVAQAGGAIVSAASSGVLELRGFAIKRAASLGVLELPVLVSVGAVFEAASSGTLELTVNASAIRKALGAVVGVLELTSVAVGTSTTSAASSGVLELVSSRAVASAPILTYDERPFLLEVRDNSGVILDVLESTNGGRMILRVNEPSRLSFSVPSTSDNRTNLVRPNEIWVRKKDGEIVEKFRVVDPRLRRDGSGMAVISVECDGLLSRLSEAFVEDYTDASAGADFGEVLGDMIALQVGGNQITLSPQVSGLPGTWTGVFQGITALQAIQQLFDQAGGFFFVNLARQLVWIDPLVPRGGETRRIEYGKNVSARSGIEKEVDYSGLATRLYVYGAGQGTARISIAQAAGQSDTFLDSDTQGTWGVVPRSVTFPSICDPDVLLEAGTIKLELVKNPITSYVINAHDLSEDSRGLFSPDEKFELGTTVLVNDSEIGISDLTATITGMEVNLDRPIDVRLELC